MSGEHVFETDFKTEDPVFETEYDSSQGGESTPGEAVLYTKQELTDEQKAQARKNIDALGEEELPSAVDDALRQAKESGEFDGKNGKDYVLTDADKTEIAEEVAMLIKVNVNSEILSAKLAEVLK